VKKTRTEITIEFDELIHATAHSKGVRNEWCAACGTNTIMITPPQAAVIAGVTVRAINRWVESEVVHFLETNDGLLFVCVNSLSQQCSASNDDEG
jgi:hypothetical protein